jgi:hypothetical protein
MHERFQTIILFSCKYTRRMTGNSEGTASVQNIEQESVKKTQLFYCRWIFSNQLFSATYSRKNLQLLNRENIEQRWASKLFFLKSANQKSANSWAHSLPQIRKFLRFASPQIANPQIFMIYPQISNQQSKSTA